MLIILGGGPTTKPSVQSEGSPQAKQEQDPVEQQSDPSLHLFSHPRGLGGELCPKNAMAE